MNNVSPAATAILLVALACVSVYAQSAQGEETRVSVPFDFQAGVKLLPAGEYHVHWQRPRVSLFRVRSRE